MTKLPKNIKDRFFRVLEGTEGLESFENWVYETKVLEELLSEEDYLDLISFNYKRPAARYELGKILEKHLKPGDFETWKLCRLLNRVNRDNKDLADTVASFYELYCRGYSFLVNLGLGYGLAVEFPPRKYGVKTWNKLSQTQRDEILDSFFPEIEEEVKKVLKWLNEGKIVITGREAGYGYLKYQDNRTDEEKKTTSYIAQEPKAPKKWWQFWKG